jgi:hypothetical protein
MVAEWKVDPGSKKSALSQSHLRALDSFIGPRIFYPLLADELVPFGT